MNTLIKQGRLRGPKVQKTGEEMMKSLNWGNMEKETLKKYMLNFGYGRWKKVRMESAC